MVNKIVLPLKLFLTLTHCPPKWAHHDLYLLRDDDVVFYVGQSHNAFERVWDHLRDGFKGRSTVGRFVLCNWPHALHFTVELLHSQAELFPPLNPPRQAQGRLPQGGGSAALEDELLPPLEGGIEGGLNRDTAERRLIEQFAPCFNEALNEHPTPLPDWYELPNALVRHPRSLKKMILEADYAVRYERRNKVQEWG